MISARSARAIKQDGDKILFKMQIKEIDKIVKTTARCGYDWVDLRLPLTDEVVNFLKKKGYKIEKINYTFFTIFWREE